MPRSKRTRTARPRRGRKLNKRQIDQVKRVVAVRQELKYLNVTQSGFALSTTPTIHHVSAISQGTTDNQRDGDRLMLRKIYFRYNVIGGDTYNYLRIMVFQWKAENIAAPIASDILLIGSSGVPDFTSQYNHDKRSLYKVMYDKVLITIGDGSQTALSTYPYASNYSQYHKKTLIVPNKQLQYVGASATQGQNQIYVMTLSDSGLPAPHPAMSYTMKILFTDS